MTFTNTIKVDVGHPWKTAQVYVKQGDKDSRKIRAELMNGAASWTIPVGTVATFRAKKPDDTVVTQDATISSPNIVEVVLDEQVGAVFGVVRGEIRLVNGGEILNTFLIAINVEAAAVTDGDIVSRDVLDEYQALVEQMLAVAGSPLVANAAADMTDKTRVYVYTGSEDGYVTGDWYYWDGAAWTAGGAYNSQGIGDAFIEQTADYIRQSTVATESDKTPYLYRPTPNPSAILADERIVGGTVAFNQLVNNGNYADGTTNWTRVDSQTTSISVSDGILKVTATGNSSQGVYATVPDGIVGHAYLAVFQVKAETAGHQFGVAISQASLNTNTIVPIFEMPTAWTTVAGIRKVTTASQNRLRIAVTTATAMAANDFFSLKNVILIDLTAMFGSTIADYLYTLETGTPGAGVAKLKEWGFLSKAYFAYDAGSLVSVKTEGKRVTGKNLFHTTMSSQTTSGVRFDVNSDGTINLSGTASALIEVTVGTIDLDSAYTYKFNGSNYSSNGCRLQLKKTGEGTKQQYSGNDVNVANPTTGTWTITLVVVSGNNVTGQTIKPMIRLDGTSGLWSPFKQHTYPLTDTALNGIFKLDASNNLYADGDIYEADGTITRKWKAVDMGSLTWDYHSNGYLYATLSDKANGNFNLICGPYTTTTETTVANMQDKEIKGNASNTAVYVKDSAYTDGATFASAMSGVYIVYELATATTETATPFTACQIVGKGGTEEWIDSRAVPVPVGHETVYGIGVPDVPANASNATLKATVSGGKTTLSWS